MRACVLRVPNMINYILFKLSNGKLLFQQQETKTLCQWLSIRSCCDHQSRLCVCNCDHSSLMERGPFVVMSMTYMPTSADTLFVLCIFRLLILVHSFIMRWRADFLFLVRGNDDDSSTSSSSSSFWNHEPE
jgi:hypothetical protein